MSNRRSQVMTPGPWEQTMSVNNGKVYVTPAGNPDHAIALCDTEGTAKAVTALPDLLDAIRMQNQSLTSGYCCCPHQDGMVTDGLHATHCEAMRKALRKAGCDAPPTKSPGQLAYEEDVRLHPIYPDHRPRRTWDQLREFEQDTWHANPTPRKTVKGPVKT